MLRILEAKNVFKQVHYSPIESLGCFWESRSRGKVCNLWLCNNLGEDGGLNNGIVHSTGKKNSIDLEDGFVRVIGKKWSILDNLVVAWENG